MGRERKTLEPREAIENTIGMAENARVSEIHHEHDSWFSWNEKTYIC